MYWRVNPCFRRVPWTYTLLGTTQRTWPQLPRKPPIKKTKQGEENPSLLRLVVESRVPVCNATSQHQALDKAGWRPGFRDQHGQAQRALEVTACNQGESWLHPGFHQDKDLEPPAPFNPWFSNSFKYYSTLQPLSRITPRQ